ncbi:MAG: c-type cytochrome [Thermaceae bacterium]
MVVNRIEVYLDRNETPLAVLKEPPYTLRLDTRTLPDGEHTLRIYTYYREGGVDIREIPFTVNNYPSVLIQGLDEKTEVSGTLELRLSVGQPDLPVEPVRVSLWAYVVALVVVLGGVWSFFALSSTTDRIIAEMASPPSAEESQASSPIPTGIDEALMKKGEQIYQQLCVGCHQANGQSLSPAFPALAGNANLKDAAMVKNVIQNGLGAMPAVGANLSEEDLKAVATYIRNSFGNTFGPVE